MLFPKQTASRVVLGALLLASPLQAVDAQNIALRLAKHITDLASPAWSGLSAAALIAVSQPYVQANQALFDWANKNDVSKKVADLYKENSVYAQKVDKYIATRVDVLTSEEVAAIMQLAVHEFNSAMKKEKVWLGLSGDAVLKWALFAVPLGVVCGALSYLGNKIPTNT